MEKLFLYYRRLRDILIYSDTQVMELALILVLCVINPTSIDRLNTTPDLWTYSGVILGLFLFIGIIEDCIIKRFWATNLLAAHSVGILAFEIVGTGLEKHQISYVVQFLVILYITWKCSKEMAYKSARQHCKGGIKSGK
tara:strand:+ start:582 stop:998 length:417 start_codon:yes stop_codon:yes gene_type:complete